jgi:hypothetical protein
MFDCTVINVSVAMIEEATELVVHDRFLPESAVAFHAFFISFPIDWGRSWSGCSTWRRNMTNKHHKIARLMTLVVVTSALLSGALVVEVTAETSASLSKKELKTLLATANTAADHQRLAEYYRNKAERLTAKAQEFSAEADRLATQPATVESKQGISCNCPSHYRYWSKRYAQEARDSGVQSCHLPALQFFGGGGFTGLRCQAGDDQPRHQEYNERHGVR